MDNRTKAALAVFITVCAAALLMKNEPEKVLLGGRKIETELEIQSKNIMIFDDSKNAVVEMPLEEYIVCVVAAEMPVSFEEEALCAQAVAARTYALRNEAGKGCNRAAGAAVCTSSSHCQAFCSEERMRARWGDHYDSNHAKIVKVVEKTRGLVMEYEGDLIVAMYHASSGGMTESVEHVYKNALPYLRGVESPGDLGEGSLTLSTEEFKKKLLTAFPEAKLDTAKLSQQVEILSRFESGRVEKLRVGNITMKGTKARGVFGLRSTNFSLDFSNGVTFQTLGFGHGVGMSQTGANAMARNGADFHEILAHYYTGIEIVQL